MTSETSAQLQIWRDKALAGTLSQDELRDAIKLLREDRVRAAVTSTKSRAKKAPVDSDAMLGELDNL